MIVVLMVAVQEASGSRAAAHRGWRVVAEADECKESKRSGRKTSQGKSSDIHVQRV